MAGNSKGRSGKILCVVGGQWGSESKGQLIEYLAKRRLMDVCVRTGSVNAGHSVFFEGKKYAMQSVPAGWVGGKRVVLVIGAGAYLEIETLDREIKTVAKALTGQDLETCNFEDMPFHLYIDPKAGMHTKKHQQAEEGLHQRMGSTGKGCMAAMIDKMERRNEYQNFGNTDYAKELDGKWFNIVDTCELINEYYDAGKVIVLEGTQGAHLDLIHGDYPYVTSRPTNAAAWLAEAGLSPTLKNEVCMVVRTMPIRVAGNSGPLPGEISWADAARIIDPERKLLTEEEIQEFELTEASVLVDWQLPADIYTWDHVAREHYSKELSALHNEVFKRMGAEKTEKLKSIFEITTVTRKLRRIAKINYDVLKKSARLNRPTWVHLTFLNYVFPKTAGLKTWDAIVAAGGSELQKFIADVESACGAPVRYVGTSPTNVVKVGKI